MRDRYSHRERIEMIMLGEKPDRFAASVWRHFFHKESDIDGLVEAMLDFQKRFDWDFMKINPRASYHVEDWGNKLIWSRDEFTHHQKVDFAVKSITDWLRIAEKPPLDKVRSDHLTAVRMIRKACGPDLPLMMTIFCPLGVARYLVGSEEKLREHLAEDSKAVITALENIALIYEKYARDCIDAGADGIFYATLEWASSETITYEQYERLGKPYDLRILKAAGDNALNILHVCHSNNYLRQMADYPVRLINWEAYDPTNPDIDSVFGFLGDKTVIAGLDNQGWLWHGKPDEITGEIAKIKERMSGKRFIFGPGCAIAPEISYSNLAAVRKSL